jgi:hypothetical protein
MAIKTGTGRGGKRPGAGRKSLLSGQYVVTVAITMAPDLLARINAEAKKAGKSRSSYIGDLLRKGLQEGDKC